MMIVVQRLYSVKVNLVEEKLLQLQVRAYFTAKK